MTKPDLLEMDPAYREAWAILQQLAHAASPAGASDEDLEGGTDVQSVPPSSDVGRIAHPSSLPRDNAVQHWSETILRHLIETLPDALVVIDPHGAIVLLNEQTERLFGYKREELLGHPVEVLVPERFRRTHGGHRDRYFALPRSRPMGANLELFGRRKDGTEFPVEISLSPLQTPQGMLATSVIRDVSQRKRDEAKFRTLVEHIPAVTFIAPLDESASELYVSPQIEKMLGFSQREWLEDPVLWHRQLHPDDLTRWNLQFAPTCATGEPFRSIYRFLAKDGRVVWVQGSANIVRDAEGRPCFLQGVAFDITSIKEAEETLRQSNAELDRRVTERTEALTRAMAELEHFAHVAVHDLKKPLSSLVSYPEKLAKHYKGKLTEEADKWIDRTIGGATRLRLLIDLLEDYSQVVQREREKQPLDTVEIVQAARANLEAEIEQNGAEVSWGELPWVNGNRAELVLLFQNLIGNAVKYRAPDRGVRLEIGAHPEQANVRFWVRDNGIGIEERFFKQIFGLGGKSRLNAKSPGWGYGLHICQKIVSEHGGRIWVESQFGQGSTFCFTLPAAPTRE